MSSPDYPDPPDPKETASAQTATNVATATANAWLGNVNQKTPYGSLDFKQTGQKFIEDGTSGQEYNINGKQVRGYYIPQFTATQTLAPDQKSILWRNNQTSKNLADTAMDRSKWLKGYLGNSIDASKLPEAGDAGDLYDPRYRQFEGNAKLQGKIASAGPITRTYGTDFSADRQRVEDAMFSRANPQIERDRAAMEASLANRGIRLGSAAHAAAVDDFNRGVSDQRTSIILGAGQEQSRLADLEARRAGFENAAQAQQYGQNLQSTQFSNDVRQANLDNVNRARANRNALEDRRLANSTVRLNAQNAARSTALSELFALRSAPLNEIQSLLSGAQIQQPSFVSTSMPTLPNVDYGAMVGDNYKSRLAIAQQQAADRQAMLGGLFGVGAAFAGNTSLFSDRRLKTDVKKVGKTDDGQNIYSYRYKAGGPQQIGLMAQEVEKRHPEAVTEVEGFKAVDYGKALGGLLGLGSRKAA